MKYRECTVSRNGAQKLEKTAAKTDNRNMSQELLKNSEVTEPGAPIIFSYQDYKTFLRDYFNFMKVSDPKFSIRKFAVKAEISSAYLPMILNTAQDISDNFVEKITPVLNLTRAEASYFRILCSIRDGSDPIQRDEAIAKLQRFHKFSKLNPKESLVSKHFSKWYYVAIREMANEPDFQFNPAWVQKRLNFPVPLSEVSKALEFLFKNHLIMIKSNGRFSSSDEHLVCEGNLFRFILTHFHKQFFELAAQAIDNTKRSSRNIRSHTVCLTPKQFEQAQEIMNQCIEAISKLSDHATDQSAVYHFLSLGFPLSKVRDGSKE
jgi:uncharacterized protein (TIGR02147 family)